MGYHSATPIQSQAIPEAVLGRDIVATAQTGTGKTAAFLLPILERTLELPPGRIYALVLTPTRELALQAEGFLKKLGHYTKRRGAAVYGGVGMEPQARALQGGAEIIVATPGRLLDHMNRGYVDFGALRILVLDEADRMLDMGFIPDVRRILSGIPRVPSRPSDGPCGLHDGRGRRRRASSAPGLLPPQTRPPAGAASGRDDVERPRLRPHQASSRPTRSPAP